uniref:Uncharacterized protein n=1 Tax=Manihot esculenta TaxID=3983 RepID=A0A2C9VLF7_MANES
MWGSNFYIYIYIVGKIPILIRLKSLCRIEVIFFGSASGIYPVLTHILHILNSMLHALSCSCLANYSC